MNYNLWISNEIFNCSIDTNFSDIIDKEDWMRSYEIWEYSRTLIEDAQNDFHLADGITNLKRSFNQRLKLIEDLYRLKLIDFSNRPKGYLELLEKYGLVRPFIMKVLLTIRNDIEHNDATPPNIERCKELVDVVWYFLKSTDHIVQKQNEGGTFNLLDEENKNNKYWVEFEIDFTNNHNVSINGWLPKELISFKEEDNYLKVDAIKIGGKKDYQNEGLHKDRLDNDIFFDGSLNLNADEKYILLKKYFTLYL